jgi:hypothetical protein
MNALQAAAAEFEEYYSLAMAPIDTLRFQAVRCLKAYNNKDPQWSYDDHWGSSVCCVFGYNWSTFLYSVVVTDQHTWESIEMFEGELLEKASEPSLLEYLGSDLPQVVRRAFAE